MNNISTRMRPIILGSVTMILLSVTPFISFINLFFCSGIILGGVAAVLSYNKQTIQFGLNLYYKDAVIIGILSGILSAVIISGFNILILLYSKNNPFIEMKSLVESFSNSFPEITKEFDKLSAEYDRYGYSPTLSIFMFLMHIVIYPLFGSIGALITVSVVNKRKHSNINSKN